MNFLGNNIFKVEFFPTKSTSSKSQLFEETRVILRCSIRLFQWGKKIISQYSYRCAMPLTWRYSTAEISCRKYFWAENSGIPRSGSILNIQNVSHCGEEIISQNCMSHVKTIMWILKVRNSLLVEALYGTSTCQKARHHCSTPGKCTEASHQSCPKQK